MSNDSSPYVSYPVKELLDNLGKEIARGFDELKVGMEKLDTRLEQKASIERVAGVEKELKALEERHGLRLSNLENKESATSAITGMQGKWTFGAIGFVGTLIAALIYLAASGVH